MCAKKIVPQKKAENTGTEKPRPTSNGFKETPRKSERKESNTSLWMMIFLITTGCGCGFYFFFNELQTANSALVEQVTQLSNEIKALSKLKFDVQANTKKFESLSEIKAAYEDVMDQIKLLEQSLKSINLDIPKLTSKVKQNEENVQIKVSHVEKSMRLLEETMTEKVSLLERLTAQEIEKLTKLTVESKQLVETLRTDQDEIRINMKTEVSDLVRQISQDLTQLRASGDSMSAKQSSLEKEISQIKLKFVTDTQFNDIQEQVLQISDKLNSATDSYSGVQNAIDQSALRVESQISTLTAHVKATKDGLSSMRDEVGSLRELTSEIKKMAEYDEQQATPPKSQKP